MLLPYSESSMHRKGLFGVSLWTAFFAQCLLSIIIHYSTQQLKWVFQVIVVRWRPGQRRPLGGKADWEDSLSTGRCQGGSQLLQSGDRSFSLVQSRSPWRVNKLSAIQCVFKGNQTFSDLHNQNLTCELLLFVSSCKEESCPNMVQLLTLWTERSRMPALE